MWKVIAAIYVTFWVTLAFSSVGEVPRCSVEVVKWYFPYLIALIIGSPIYLGYMIISKD